MWGIVAPLAAAVTSALVVMLASAWWLRSGARRVPPPPGFNSVSWSTAVRMAFAQQVRPNVIGFLAIFPGIGHLALGRVGRAVAVLAAIAATVGLSIILGTVTGTCGCEAGSAGGRLRTTVTLLILLAIVVVSAFDATRIATRRAMFRALLQSIGWARGAELTLASCPRCRAAERTADGFCAACCSTLASSAVGVHSPAVRATSLGAADKPELAALRGSSLVIGSIAGEAAKLSHRFERIYARRIDRLLRAQQRDVEAAWRDPAAPDCLWTVERFTATSHEGDVLELQRVCLHAFDSSGLRASWTTSVLQVRHSRAPRRHRVLRAQPAPQTLT